MFFLFASGEPAKPNARNPSPTPPTRHLWQNMRRMIKTPWTRNRSTWMWVAIAAVAFTSVAHAEAGSRSAKSYGRPVFEFLARSQSQNSAALSGVLRFAHLGSRRQADSRLRITGSRTLIAMLPVLFIGLVSPLDRASAASIRCLDWAPPVPPLPALFQRPPPSLA